MLLGKEEDCDLVEGNVSLEVGFQSLKTHPSSCSLCFRFVTKIWVLSFLFLLLCLLPAACCLLSTPPWWTLISLEPNKLFLLEAALFVTFDHCNRNIANRAWLVSAKSSECQGFIYPHFWYSEPAPPYQALFFYIWVLRSELLFPGLQGKHSTSWAISLDSMSPLLDQCLSRAVVNNVYFWLLAISFSGELTKG